LDNGGRTIDEKFEVQAFRVAEAAAVEIVLESIEVSGLGAVFTRSHLCLSLGCYLT